MTLEEAKKIIRDHTQHLVDKWSKTNLLDGTESDIEKTNMSVLIESEEKWFKRTEMTPEQRMLDDAYRVLADSKKL